MTTECIYTCATITSYTKDISQLIFLPTTDKKITYTSGQYVEAMISDKATLALSIANMPNPDGLLEFHLRHDEKNPKAQELMAALAKNKLLRLRGPFGKTTLTYAEQAKNLLFLAGGTGFAPIKALLEEALYAEQSLRLLFLYWGVKKPQDAYQEKLLKQWRQTFPHFDYTIVLSEPEYFKEWQGPTGLAHEYLAKQHAQFTDHYIFASGPFAMVKAAQLLFTEQGLSTTKLSSDML